MSDMAAGLKRGKPRLRSLFIVLLSLPHDNIGNTDIANLRCTILPRLLAITLDIGQHNYRLRQLFKALPIFLTIKMLRIILSIKHHLPDVRIALLLSGWVAFRRRIVTVEFLGNVLVYLLRFPLKTQFPSIIRFDLLTNLKLISKVKIIVRTSI